MISRVFHNCYPFPGCQVSRFYPCYSIPSCQGVRFPPLLFVPELCCVLHPCYSFLRCQVLRFPPLLFVPSLLGPAFSATAIIKISSSQVPRFQSLDALKQYRVFLALIDLSIKLVTCLYFHYLQSAVLIIYLWYSHVLLLLLFTSG